MKQGWQREKYREMLEAKSRKAAQEGVRVKVDRTAGRCESRRCFRACWRECFVVFRPALRHGQKVPTYMCRLRNTSTHEARYTLASAGKQRFGFLVAWWMHACAEPISVLL